MGEWSKKIGEMGESIVSNLLEEIGWGDAQKNVTIPCIYGQRHGSNEKERTTHGIDCFFSYPSRLSDRTLDHLIISTKYSSSPYPENPVSKFKEHFFDLARTIECFKKSALRSNASRQFSGIGMARNIGILFWLTNDDRNINIVSKVAGCRKLDEYAHEAIFVVDDFRAAFLYDAIRYVRQRYADSKVEFLYPYTGRNINPNTREAAGNVLPVEFVNSPVLPFRTTMVDNRKQLVLASSDKFSGDHLKRLLGMAQVLSQEFAAKTLILYPDYVPLQHENFVLEAKSGFENKSYTESVVVDCFHDSHRSVAQ